MNCGDTLAARAKREVRGGKETGAEKLEGEKATN